jgi:hypothetical protein
MAALKSMEGNSKDIRTTTGVKQQIVNVCTAIAIAA